MPEKIGEWTPSRLTNFVLATLRSPATLPNAMTFGKLTLSEMLTVADQLELSPQAIDYLESKLEQLEAVSTLTATTGTVTTLTSTTGTITDLTVPTKLNVQDELVLSARALQYIKDNLPP
jgi:hypothetical protein